MRTSLLVPVLACVVSALSAQAQPADLDRDGVPYATHMKQRTPSRSDDGLNGPVQSVLVTQTWLTNEGEPRQTPPPPVERIAYDREGRRTERLSYRNGAIEYKQVYTYDEQGNLSRETWYDAEGTVRWRWEYVRNEEGRGVKVELCNEEGTLRKSESCTYEGTRTATSQVTYGADGKPQVKALHRVSRHGGNAEHPAVITYALGSHRTITTYDEHGNRIVLQFKSARGTTRPSGGPRYKWALILEAAHIPIDEHGSTERTMYLPDGTLRSKTVTICDEHGKPTRGGSSQRDEPFIWRWRRENDYDAHGNWIRERRFRRVPADGSFAPSEELTRTITYYPEGEG